jgi:hypothetical protein
MVEDEQVVGCTCVLPPSNCHLGAEIFTGLKIYKKMKFNDDDFKAVQASG